MTKQEYIKLKWEEAGMDFDTIRENVNEDGWHLGDVDLIPEKVYQKCSHYSKSLGKMAERPKSLNGIEHNNGWTHIEPDGSNLPKIKGEYRFLDINLGDDIECTFNPNSTTIDKAYTHYRPIVEIPEPLY